MKRTLIVLSALSLIWVSSLGCEEDAQLGSVNEPEEIDTETAYEPPPAGPPLRSAECPDYYTVFSLRDELLARYNDDRASVYDINNRGELVVVSTKYENYTYGSVGFRWTPIVTEAANDDEPDIIEVGEIFEFPDMDEERTGTKGYTINNQGEVIGTINAPMATGRGTQASPAYWNETDGHSILWDAGVNALERINEVNGINNEGRVVGARYSVDFGDYEFDVGFSWTAAGGYEPLPIPDGAQKFGFIRAIDINDSGQILGQGKMLEYLPTASFIWSEKDGYKLLRGYGPLGYEDTVANKIDKEGRVVGQAVTYNNGRVGFTHPVVWDEYGYPHDLGILPQPETLISGEAADMNDNGLIVGTDTQPKGRSFAWVYCEGSKRALEDMLEPNPENEDYVISWASAVNDDGQIAASGTGGPYFLHPRYLDPITAE